MVLAGVLFYTSDSCISISVSGYQPTRMLVYLVVCVFLMMVRLLGMLISVIGRFPVDGSRYVFLPSSLSADDVFRGSETQVLEFVCRIVHLHFRSALFTLHNS